MLNWQISADWRYDSALDTEVEVRFIADDETRTRVELEHRGLSEAYVGRDARRCVEHRRVAFFTRLPRTQLLVAISIVIGIAELFANEIVLGDEGDSDVGGWVGLSLFGIALSAILVLVVVPRSSVKNRRTLVLALGGGAVVTCVVFWSAIPFALGAAALAAAAPGDDTPEGEAPAPSTAGVLLALLAILAAFILCLTG